jgi:hypothetical protein
LCNEKHGAPTQCTVGKCTKSFHVSCCFKDGSGIDIDAFVIGNSEDGKEENVSLIYDYERANQFGGETIIKVLCRTHNPVSFFFS